MIGVAAWCLQPPSDPGGPDEVGPELNASAGNFSVRTQLRASKFESVLGPLVGIKKVTNMWGSLVPKPRHLESTPNRKLAPDQGFEL